MVSLRMVESRVFALFIVHVLLELNSSMLRLFAVSIYLYLARFVQTAMCLEVVYLSALVAGQRVTVGSPVRRVTGRRIWSYVTG